jgi:hypothetical protein
MCGCRRVLEQELEETRKGGRGALLYLQNQWRDLLVHSNCGRRKREMRLKFEGRNLGELLYQATSSPSPQDLEGS